MANLDLFLTLLGTKDVLKKISIGDEIKTNLASTDNPPKCEDIGSFIEGLNSWINNSNFKVCQNGLEILSLLVDRLKEDFRPYIPAILTSVVDRLGDSKDSVREKADDFILKLMECSIQPQVLWERLLTAFIHRNNRVREEIHKILIITLDSYGSSSLSLNKLVPSIVKCLSDPTPAVRDAAFHCLVEIYRHVGEKVRTDLIKRGNVPPAKLSGLLAKFDEVRDAGDLILATAVLSLEGATKTSEDETDRSLVLTGSKRATSAPAIRKLMAPPPTIPAISSIASTGPLVGGVDEETFIRAFDDVPKILIYSAKEMEEHLISMRKIIQDPKNDWAKRVETLKKIRSLLIAGAANYDELWQHIRLLETAFQTSVKDLRSQVVREACVSIAYMSQQLQNRLDHFAEALLDPLIILIPNSAKIIATAGTVCIRFIIANTHSARLIPVLTKQMTSKSKDIRRAMFEFLDQLLHTWPIHILEKHVVLIQSAISDGIKDADPDARAFSRKAYGGFASHFPDQADALFHSLDFSYQKILYGEASLSNSSSNNSLQSAGLTRPSTKVNSGPASLPVHPRLKVGSLEDLNRLPGIPTREIAMPTYGARPRGVTIGSPFPTSFRSYSAIDIQAANRASQSQPGSRSGSPSSRYSYKTYDPADVTPIRHVDSSTLGRPRRLSSGGMNATSPRGPPSSNTSREPSPNRSGNSSVFSKTSRTRSQSGYGENVFPSRPSPAQKNLPQSREAETALSDALTRPIPNTIGTDIFMSPMEQADRATMQRILAFFGKEDSESRKEGMRMLLQLMHQGAGNLIEDNFRPVFKHLVSCREDPDSLVRRQVFNLWGTMLNTPKLLEEMENYADLILVNIFRAQRDQEREVVRAAEGCAKTVAAVLSLIKLTRFLKPVIGDNYPENYTAIKTLTRLVEQRPHEDTVTILPDMMPALLLATDHTESFVRKAAVFCIVEIYKRAPEELKPYLESLPSSKVKLINVFIQKAGLTSI